MAVSFYCVFLAVALLNIHYGLVVGLPIEYLVDPVDGRSFWINARPSSPYQPAINVLSVQPPSVNLRSVEADVGPLGLSVSAPLLRLDEPLEARTFWINSRPSNPIVNPNQPSFNAPSVQPPLVDPPTTEAGVDIGPISLGVGLPIYRFFY